MLTDYLEKLRDAYYFYAMSSDGQYDMFVCEIISREYFAYTGIDLDEEFENA